MVSITQLIDHASLVSTYLMLKKDQPSFIEPPEKGIHSVVTSSDYLHQAQEPLPFRCSKRKRCHFPPRIPTRWREVAPPDRTWRHFCVLQDIERQRKKEPRWEEVGSLSLLYVLSAFQPTSTCTHMPVRVLFRVYGVANKWCCCPNDSARTTAPNFPDLIRE